MKNIVYLVLLALFVLASGCGKKQETQTTSGGQDKTAVQVSSSTVEEFIPPVSTYSTVTQCPVMGNKFTITKDTKAVRYKGKEYFFCCPSCISDFKKNPDKYIRY